LEYLTEEARERGQAGGGGEAGGGLEGGNRDVQERERSRCVFHSHQWAVCVYAYTCLKRRVSEIVLILEPYSTQKEHRSTCIYVFI
jgi:hypothetical protein